jgi:hypothetical protein
MKKQPDKLDDIEQIADMAQAGKDVSAYFTGRHVAKQQVTIDFPLELLRMIDAECQLLGITREAWIKMACNDKLRQIQMKPVAVKVAA